MLFLVFVYFVSCVGYHGFLYFHRYIIFGVPVEHVISFLIVFL